MDMVDYLKARREYSVKRISEIKEILSNSFKDKFSDNVCIYATGSYARHEANQHSDLDVFIAVNGKKDENESEFTLSKVQECEIIHGLEKMRVELKLPEFTDGGRYLKFHSEKDLIRNIGNTKDDFENTFTARMLLLLESKPLYGDLVYDEIMLQITNAYFNDFHDHVDEFNPVFLVNDILRFWRTMCLNYENKRTYREGNGDKGHLQNLKLKFSRLLICFATIGYLAEKGRGLPKEDMINLIKLTPRARLDSAVQAHNEFEDKMLKSAALYSWFMRSMNASTEEITVWIMNENSRIEAFTKAKEFGDIMYDVIFSLAKKSEVERFLVI